MSDYDKLYKIVFVGDSGVGKSSLLLRFTDNQFNDTFIATIGVDFRTRTIEIAGKKYKLQIWDTAGQERFRTITAAYYNGAHGICIVYDVNDNVTFEHVNVWMNEIARSTRPNARSAIQFLVGNKIDQDPSFRQVDMLRAKRVAEDNGMRFMEVSAKANLQVENVFSMMTSAIASYDKSLESKEEKAKFAAEGALILDEKDKPNPDGASCC